MKLRPGEELKLEWSVSVRHPFGGKEHKFSETIPFAYDEVVAALQSYRKLQDNQAKKAAAAKKIVVAPMNDLRLKRSIGAIKANSPQKNKILADMLEKVEKLSAKPELHEQQVRVINSHRDDLADLISSVSGLKDEHIERVKKLLIDIPSA